jgi:hypothetical protein
VITNQISQIFSRHQGIDGHKKTGSNNRSGFEVLRVKAVASTLTRAALVTATTLTATLAALITAAITATATATTAVAATVTAATRAPEREATGHGRHYRDNHREFSYTTQHNGYSLNDRQFVTCTL